MDDITVMHIFPLLFFVLISVIACVACVVDRCTSSPELDPVTGVIWAVVLLVTFSWSVAVFSRPKEYTTHIETPVYFQKAPNGMTMQMVAYTEPGRSGSLKTLNMNQRFGASLPEGTIVRLSFVKTGPYCGVSFAGMLSDGPEISIVQPKE